MFSNTITKSYFVETQIDKKFSPRTTEYNNELYVRYLNKCLTLTLNALRAYSAVTNQHKYRKNALNLQECCNILQNLITENSGISENQSDLGGEFSRAMIQITNIFPSKLHRHTCSSAFMRIEKRISFHLKSLFQLAPRKDKLTIHTIHSLVQKNITSLSSINSFLEH